MDGAIGLGGDLVTPIGPFCPFRSYACNFAPTVTDGDLSTPVVGSARQHVAAEFSTEVARLQLDAQVGSTPDLSKMRELALALQRTHWQWEERIEQMGKSDDFQSLEYHALIESKLKLQGSTIWQMAARIKYQADSMLAMAEMRQPPLPPIGVDLRQPCPDPPPQPSMVMQASPWTGREALFESDIVRSELLQLESDHRNLINIGGRYGTFDAIGKDKFIDMVEDVEDRWDVFFKRASLVGAINPEYRDQSAKLLSSMRIGSAQFRSLLGAAHDRMRIVAETERP